MADEADTCQLSVSFTCHSTGGTVCAIISKRNNGSLRFNNFNIYFLDTRSSPDNMAHEIVLRQLADNKWYSRYSSLSGNRS